MDVSVRFKKLVIKNYGIFKGKNEITFNDHQTFIVGSQGTGKTTIVQYLETLGIDKKIIPSSDQPKPGVAVETSGDSSLLHKYRQIIFLGDDSGYYRDFFEEQLSVEKIDKLKRVVVIEETRDIFSKLLIHKPWKKKNPFEQMHMMATGERLCYFVSFAFAMRKVFNLDIPIVFDDLFGLLDSHLKEGTESFLKNESSQQIFFVHPKELINKVKHHYVLKCKYGYVKIQN